MIRTFIVDDQRIIREGIKVLLEDSTEIELVGYATDGETALEKIEEAKPDVVLLDINLPGIDGLMVAEQIREKFPQIKVIMLSSCEDEESVSKAMASSAKGYLLKSVSAQELRWSIELVHQGYSAFKSELLASFSKPIKEVVTKAKPAEHTKVVSAVKQNNSSKLSSPWQSDNPDELELLIARNQIKRKYASFKNQRDNLGFYDNSVSKTKKTIMSFEFKLLVFIILFSLGFLVFVALS